MLKEMVDLPWKAIVTSSALFAAVGSAVGYLFRRRIERTRESEELEKLHKTADLHRKLRDQQISIDELRALRGQVIQKELQAATATAQYFVYRAERLASAPAEAAVSYLSSTGSPDGNQAEMNAYAAEQFQLADVQLQEVIAAKRAAMDAETRRAFDDSQAAWVAWREVESLLEGRVWEGGSIRPLMVASKREAMTRARIADLQMLGSLAEPSITPRYPLAPRNVFEHVIPGVSSERVREMLGTPHHADSWAWTYRYAEAQLYVVMQDDRVREVTLALVQGHALLMDFVHFDLELGRATFADLIAEDPHAIPQCRFSARTKEIYAATRIGHSAAWRTYFFGALVPYGPDGLLLSTTFDWDSDEHMLRSSPAETIINWVGLSGDEEPPSFAWFITP